MIIFNARNKPLESLPASSLSLTASSSTSSALDAQLSNDTDYNENPLKCPLDLGPLTDGAAGITTLIDRSVDRIVRKFKPAAQPARPLVKAKADLAVFSGRSKTVKASSDGLKAEVQFVSPFRRYELLRPYLDSIEQQEQRAQLQQLQKHHLDTKPSDIDMRFVVFAPPPPPAQKFGGISKFGFYVMMKTWFTVCAYSAKPKKTKKPLSAGVEDTTNTHRRIYQYKCFRSASPNVDIFCKKSCFNSYQGI
jgi:hypothetical protein